MGLVLTISRSTREGPVPVLATSDPRVIAAAARVIASFADPASKRDTAKVLRVLDRPDPEGR